MTTRRNSANSQDYPEHLNPFHEEDNHTKLRFWTITKKKTRSNSFSFQSMKDFKGSIRLPRSRNRTDTSSSLSQLNCYGTKPKTETQQSESSQSNNRFFSTLRKLSRSFSIRNKNKNSSSSLDQTSQIENDEVQIRVSPSSRQTTESYSASQRLSVTPLPRSRFHERVRNSENPEPQKSPEKTDSPVSTPSTDVKNPFNDDTDDETKETLRPHSPSKPVTPARKKKRAPPPPPMRQSSLKAKSLLEYKTSTQNEDKSPILIEKTVVSKEELEKLDTNDNENRVNIVIKVEEVIDVNKEKEDIKTENKVEESTTQEPSEIEEITVINVETNHENHLKVSTNNEETSSQQKENEEVSSDISVEEKEQEKTEDSPIEQNIPFSVSIVNEETSSTDTVPIPDATINEDYLNYNSEVSLPSSHSSVSSEANLELQLEAVEDTSDLLELVTKLKLEVDKLTDETNNNIIETEEEIKVKNIQSWIKLESPSRLKSELSVNLDSDQIDDDDVICSAPMSPRFVRLRKDNEWIRQQN